jgi:hypothetical protein
VVTDQGNQQHMVVEDFLVHRQEVVDLAVDIREYSMVQYLREML